MSSWGSSRSQRSSASTISPFRSRKSSTPPAPPPKRPATPSPPPPPLPFSNHSVSPLTTTTDSVKSKENVTVTVRFRPLSPREINKGDEIAWYADGDFTVRNEYNSSIAYAFDRVFGPATTTRHVFDVAAQHVVSGAMQGINGTVFAYGVTSSGKTHTMHGEQKSPGIIPLAVKDVFGIIQETPSREFLLRVSYLEIYNEVINDLLDPTGQNLRIREDAQGTFVEGIKEEVVLSPAHALSLIASGEEHRHVGSNNFNILSSRSHTIFTLTIESSSREGTQGEEDVTLSQLHLIDLAGSESSKTETTGLRRKEGSFINKSLLTLGTVVSKLTDGKATHVPYRDSKLTRLLQSSLSGHGQISIICTVTPASSNSEETHNTLKFAHRSKHVEIKASQNKIMDEKSLIKKYQGEITSLKEELQQLKRGMMVNPNMNTTTQEDLVNLKLQLEAGQFKLQSRLEEEEQAKEALMGRIQRLTKLILVSTKNSMAANIPERPSHRRRHSFGEDELAYLPDRKHGYVIDDDTTSCASELSIDGRDDSNLDELVKEYKRSKRRGMLGWFKVRKPGLSYGGDSENSMSPASSRSSHGRVMFSDLKDSHRKSLCKQGDDSSIVDSYPERTRAGDLFSAAAAGHRMLPSGTTITDQMDLLREQIKMLAGEVALSNSSLKRLLELAVNNPDDFQLKEHMQKLKDEISEKKRQIHILEKRMLGSLEVTSQSSNVIEMSQALSKLTTQLNEKTFELELRTADNRILQEQLEMKMSENTEMQETILMLRQQLDLSSERGFNKPSNNGDRGATQELPSVENLSEKDNKRTNRSCSSEEACGDGNTPTSVMSLHRMLYKDDCGEQCNDDPSNCKIAMLTAELEDLKQERIRLMEQKDGLEIQAHKLEEEASYAKELASAAAVELKNLAGEVTRLTYENAKLKGNLAAAKEAPGRSNGARSISRGSKQYSDARPDGRLKKPDDGWMIEEMQRELDGRLRREADLETIISEKDEIEGELRRKLNEAKHCEENLENELANMWVLVSKLRKSGANAENSTCGAVPASNPLHSGMGNGSLPSDGHLSKDDTYQGIDEQIMFEAIKANYEKERERCKELECLISRLKGDDVSRLDAVALEELQNFHVEAITKICHAKVAFS